MKAQLKLHNGTPTVFFDDQPVFFGCHLVGYMVADNLKQHIPFAKQYANAGVTIHSVDNFTHEWVGPRPGSPAPYDFTLVEQRMRTFLEANPNALFLMRVGVDTGWVPSNWFNEAYPDEVELLSNGVQRSASFASARWRQLVNQLLRDFIAHLRAIGLYDRCVAFQIGAGSSGEWIKDVGCMLEDTPDYSPAMRRHFQDWLRARYGTEAALQAAWANQAVTFGTAVVPTQPEQMTTVTGQSFRDFRREQKLIDFYECLAEVSADDLISYAETVRQETQSEKLVGGFFGYVMELSWNMAFFAGTQTISEAEVSTMQRSGHLGLRRLLRSPAIDFLVSPHAYAFRGLGGPGRAIPDPGILQRNLLAAASDLASAEVRLPPYAHRLVGHAFQIGANPRVDAQFNAGYCVANVLLRGSSQLAHFSPAQVAEPALRPLIERIRVIADPALDARGHTAVDLSITTTDGRVLHDGLDIAPGFPGAGLSQAQHLARFDDCLAYASLAAAELGLQPLASAQVQGFLAALPRLAGLADVRELLPLLLAPA